MPSDSCSGGQEREGKSPIRVATWRGSVYTSILHQCEVLPSENNSRLCFKTFLLLIFYNFLIYIVIILRISGTSTGLAYFHCSSTTPPAFHVQTHDL